MTSEQPRLRLGILGLVAVGLFAALFARLWFLQVMSNESYAVAAESNRVRVVQVAAPRGRILDRNGLVLVDSRVSVVLTVDRVRFDELEPKPRQALAGRLADELTRAGQPVTPSEVIKRVHNVRFSQYTPVPIAEDVPESLKIFIEEHADEFPTVAVERSSIRRYPYGNVAAHVLGYVGEINDAELVAAVDKPKQYIKGDEIGKTGVERIYEDDLRGTPGIMRIEVDAEGEPIRVLDDSTQPIPGSDVWLTIDAPIQAYSERLLADGLASARSQRVTGENLVNKAPAGSVVVMDPKNGEVLAMASYPTYDPAEFVNGISNATWDFLNDPANHYPLNNWAIQGQYAPGSTFKLFSGFAALQAGMRQPDQFINDPGTYTIPGCRGAPDGCVRKNSGGQRNGSVDIRRAMTVSSDVYFYAIGAEAWINQDTFGREMIQDDARAFGLGSETGIPLSGEQSGRMPTAEQRRAQYEAAPEKFMTGDWRTGDNVNMAIGQGDVAVTPLQLANGYATFANGGTRYAPNIAFKVTEPAEPEAVVRALDPRVSGTVDMPPELRQPLLDGLIGVTQAPGGTAYSVFRGFPNDTWPVAGKTGTAQVDKKADTALFSAFGPAGDPRFQVTVVMEESGFGARSAAPVARKLFEVFAGVAPRPELLPGGGLGLPDPAAATVTIDESGSED